MKDLVFSIMHLITITCLCSCSSNVAMQQSKTPTASILEVRNKVGIQNTSFGDSLTTTVVFFNKTGEAIRFYPQNVMYLRKFPLGFHSIIIPINNKRNVDLVSVIPAHGQQEIVRKVAVDSSFSRGLNLFEFIYINSCGKSAKKDEPVNYCGAIASDSLRVFVK